MSKNNGIFFWKAQNYDSNSCQISTVHRVSRRCRGKRSCQMNHIHRDPKKIETNTLFFPCVWCYIGIFGSESLRSSLHPWQPLWLRSCCHLLSVLLTLRNGTCPSHCNLSLLQGWHWGGPLVTLHTFSLSRFPPLSTHLSFGAQMEPLQAKEALAVHPTFSWRICCKAKKSGFGRWGNINEKLCAVSSRVSS